jgi:hypothetical protein
MCPFDLVPEASRGDCFIHQGRAPGDKLQPQWE